MDKLCFIKVLIESGLWTFPSWLTSNQPSTEFAATSEVIQTLCYLVYEFI